MEVRDGTVMVGIGESRDERPLTSTLEIESEGSDDTVGRIFVMLASIEPSEVSPRLDGNMVREDGRLVFNVIGDSKVPVRLPRLDSRSDREDGRLVSNVIGGSRVPVRLPVLEGKLIKEDGVLVSSVTGGSKVPVRLPRLDGKPAGEDVKLVTNVICGSEVPIRLLIPDAPGRRVVIEPRRDDIEVRGFGAIEIVLTTGILSGPILTARLDTKTTVLVPLRWVPVDSAPSPLVRVHTPSV